MELYGRVAQLGEHLLCKHALISPKSFGVPADTIEALRGKIWSKVVRSDDELRSLESQMQILSTHLLGGQHEIRVYSNSNPGEGFRAIDPELEDVYFLNLSRQARN